MGVSTNLFLRMGQVFWRLMVGPFASAASMSITFAFTTMSTSTMAWRRVGSTVRSLRLENFVFRNDVYVLKNLLFMVNINLYFLLIFCIIFTLLNNSPDLIYEY
jgi:hypothetical protein